jgi:tripartite ATP-independent transporter DctM subunit
LITLSASFVLFLAVGAPIAAAILLGSAVGLVAMDVPLRAIPSRMFAGIDTFILLAAPFYVLTGELMSRSGITERLIELSMLITRSIRAGTAYAAVVTSLLFSGISGTAVGDAAALGQIFIRQMNQEGYRTRDSAGLIAAASILGPIIPPSVIMVIYASVARVSIIDLFIAGFVPGLLIGLGLCAVIWLKARGGRMPKPQVRLAPRALWRTLVDGVLVLTLPIVIIRGAASGVFTTTEAGGIAVVYALFLGMVVFRTLRFADVWASLKVTAAITASIYLILATSEVMSYAFTLAGLNQWVAALGQAFAGQPVLFLLLITVIFLLIGTFLEPGPALILFVPMLLPVVTGLGIDPIQFAMVVIVVLNLGLISPPVGIVMFVVGRIAHLDMWQLFRGIWPFLVSQVAVVILLCFFPGLSTWLPAAVK